jgi:hypothetical protein
MVEAFGDLVIHEFWGNDGAWECGRRVVFEAGY